MRTKNLTVLILISVIGLVSTGTTASPWEIIPSIYSVNQLIRIDNDIWGATNSGLFRYNLGEDSYQIFTTAHGLSSMQVNVMVQDNRGNLILGMGNAYLDIFNLQTHQVSRFAAFHEDDKIFSINALHAYNDTIFIAHDIGVSKLQYYDSFEDYLIKGTYWSLGNLTSETEANNVFVYDGGLWVGTDMGLARGDLSQAVLESPESWSNYYTEDGLSSNHISAMEVYRDTLYVGVKDVTYGLNRLTGLDEGFETLDYSNSKDIEFLKAYDDTIYCGRKWGVYRLVEGQVVRFGEKDAKALSLVFTDDGSMWAGMTITRDSDQFRTIRSGGLKTWNGEDWILRSPDGVLVEVVTDILVTDEGSLWVSGRLELGYSNSVLCHFDGTHWINLGRQNDSGDSSLTQWASPDSFFWYWTRRITQDNSGAVWIASDGRGVGWFEFKNDTIETKGHYAAGNGLFNITSLTHYCVVRDLLTDKFGNVWICNSEADASLSGDKPIVIVPAEFIEDPVTFPNWYYIGIKEENGTPLQSSQYYVDRIAEDTFGRKWFGGNNNTGEDKGVWILSDNDTPFNDQDDQWTHITGLPSDSITAIVTDRDGIVWVGTPAGVQYFYPAEDPLQLSANRVDLWGLPVGNGVNTIAIDPQNNKWFGTNQGISILASDNFTWLASYTTLDGAFPTPLPGNVVQAIAFNPETGDAWIGTDKGLARLSTPYKQMGNTLTEISIIADSNPFLIEEGGKTRLFFDAAGLSETTDMKIFTAAGFLVRELTKNEIISGWDGRNSRNELVGSGIYLLLAYDPDGNAEIGKVAVIHR